MERSIFTRQPPPPIKSATSGGISISLFSGSCAGSHFVAELFSLPQEPSVSELFAYDLDLHHFRKTLAHICAVTSFDVQHEKSDKNSTSIPLSRADLAVTGSNTGQLLTNFSLLFRRQVSAPHFVVIALATRIHQ